MILTRIAEQLSWFVWPLIASLPLVLTSNDLYKTVFPDSWYDKAPTNYWLGEREGWPRPLGLTLGILAVIVGQIFTIIYLYLRRIGVLGAPVAVQREGARQYEFSEGLRTHLGEPEGFLMLGGYLIGTWMLKIMPARLEVGISFTIYSRCPH
jgi:hypothetical protein